MSKKSRKARPPGATAPAPAAAPAAKEPPRWLPAIPAALAAAVYAQGLKNPFVYDDLATVVENPSLRSPMNLLFVLIFEPYRPLTNASYALDRLLWGLSPAGHHATSLALHVLCVVLVYLVARAALTDHAAQAARTTPASAGPALRPALALVPSLLLAVHPLATEAVAYVSGRSEVLCAAFVLGGLLAGRRWMTGGGRVHLALYLGCLVLALASREVGAVLPVLLLLWDRLLQGSDPAARSRRVFRLHVPVLALLALAAGWRASRLLASGGLEAPLGEHVTTQLVVAFRYLGLVALPVGQSIVHQVGTPPATPAVLAAGAALAGCAAMFVSLRRSYPLVALGVAWFFVALAPSGALPLAEPMAEHRAYLASVGPFLLAALGAGWLEPRLARLGAGRPTGPASLVPLALLLALLTGARLRVWSDPVTLWRDAAAKAPGVAAAHYALGDALRDAGKCDEALPAYEQAIGLYPQLLDARMNLGMCLAKVGRAGDARAAFESALAIDPRYVRAHNNLGSLAWSTGDVTGARAHYRRAVELDPKNELARRALQALPPAAGAGADGG